jgi:hypothetical protein
LYAASGGAADWEGADDWDGVGSDGVGSDGVAWDGVAWDGVAWDGMNWDGAGCERTGPVPDAITNNRASCHREGLGNEIPRTGEAGMSALLGYYPFDFFAFFCFKSASHGV